MATDETIVSNIKSLDEGADDSKKPFLTFITGSRLGELIELVKEEIVVGRSPDCGLVIDDGAISRKHFKLLVKGTHVHIMDLKSTNGTYVNGNPVLEARLKDGDKIQISQKSILELTYLDESRSLSEKKRYEMGVMDAVTNIHNKRYFLERLAEEFAHAKRKNLFLSLIMLDLDHFKVVNDTYGHLAGDLVLQKVCQVVNKTIRSNDLFARFGGEEFVIVLRDTPLDKAVELAERIRKNVKSMEMIYENHPIKVTVSSGVTQVSNVMKSPMDLIGKSDKLLYRSKKMGRNQVTGEI